jgi:hypothetical protein
MTKETFSWTDCVRVIEGPEHLMEKGIGICIRETDIATMAELGIKVIRLEKYVQWAHTADEFFFNFIKECKVNKIEVLMSLHELQEEYSKQEEYSNIFPDEHKSLRDIMDSSDFESYLHARRIGDYDGDYDGDYESYYKDVKSGKFNGDYFNKACEAKRRDRE